MKLDSSVLSVFMDTFYGCYRAKPICRHFAVVYLLLRVANLLLYSTVRGLMYFCYASYLSTFALVLVAIVRPYRKGWHNIRDIMLLVSIISFYQYANSVIATTYIDPIAVSMWPKYLAYAVCVIIFSVPSLYFLFILLWRIAPEDCIAKAKLLTFKFMNRETELQETLPHRLQQSTEHSPLIPTLTS